MNWFEWVVFIVRMCMVVAGMVFAFKASRHYIKGEYLQAIFKMQMIIFIAIVVAFGE